MSQTDRGLPFSPGRPHVDYDPTSDVLKVRFAPEDQPDCDVVELVEDLWVAFHPGRHGILLTLVATDATFARPSAWGDELRRFIGPTLWQRVSDHARGLSALSEPLQIPASELRRLQAASWPAQHDRARALLGLPTLAAATDTAMARVHGRLTAAAASLRSWFTVELPALAPSLRGGPHEVAEAPGAVPVVLPPNLAAAGQVEHDTGSALVDQSARALVVRFDLAEDAATGPLVVAGPVGEPVAFVVDPMDDTRVVAHLPLDRLGTGSVALRFRIVEPTQ